MGDLLKRNAAPLVVIFALSIFYWFGVSAVPFHPDESTQLYMAADFRSIITLPGQLFWQPDQETDQRMFYREVDPPLSRYLIGLGLMVAGQKPLDQDWNWSKSWLENQQAGALPADDQLLAGRQAVAVLFPFSLACAYWIGKKLRSPAYGWLTMGLIAVNALVLIHTRRAMAESALLFCVLLSLLGTISWKRQRFWLALPVALAFNAKYSAIPLALIGLIAVLWDFPSQNTTRKKKIINAACYCGIFLAVTLALNPFLWQAPIPALKDAINKRQELVNRQSQEIGRESSVQVLNTAGQRSVAILSQVFFAPPASADVGNYNADLLPAVKEYTANPTHTFLRSWVGGSIILFLTLAGLILYIFWMAGMKSLSRAGILFFAALLLQIGGILAVIQFPFQRYYIPLVPYVTLMLAFSLLYPFELIKKRNSAKLQ